jgi:hypothetical protein
MDTSTTKKHQDSKPIEKDHTISITESENEEEECVGFSTRDEIY